MGNSAAAKGVSEEEKEAREKAEMVIAREERAAKKEHLASEKKRLPAERKGAFEQAREEYLDREGLPKPKTRKRGRMLP